MHSVQEIHAHVAEHINTPGSWRGKDYAFEFVECISFVLQKQIRG
jgi:hypothetical protein